MAALALALAFLTVPVVAVFANTSPGELASSLGDPSRSRRAAAQPRDQPDCPRDHRRRRHPGRVPARDEALPRARARRDAGRAAARPSARGRGHRPARGARAERASSARWSRTQASSSCSPRPAWWSRSTFVSAPYLHAPGTGGLRGRRPVADWRRRARSAPARRAASSSVAMPAARAGLFAGAALAWGRALGRVRRDADVRGLVPGITQTVPLAIYERFSTDFTGALALSAVLVAVSAALLVHEAGRRPCCALSCAGGWAARARRAAGCLPGDTGAGRAVGRREDERAAGDRRAAATRARPGGVRERALARHGGRRRPPARAPRVRLSLPGVRAVPAPERVAERGVRVAAPRAPPRRGRRLLDLFGLEPPRGRSPARARRRRAPARGTCARAGAAIRARCCSTNRCPRSMPARAVAPRASWSPPFTTRGCPRCS